jgi:Na+/H+-dicarboxylate symporter
MAAPYGIIGFMVLAALTRRRPMLSFLALMLVFTAAPLALAAVVLTGILDTWLDFRKKIESAGTAP